MAASRAFIAEQLASPSDALTRFRAQVASVPCDRETVSLASAAGRALAAPIAAEAAYPDAPRAAMDGFALRAADVPGTLRIVGEARMGAAPARALGAGEALAIPTGAILPTGADAVVAIEATQVTGATVAVVEPVEVGENVHPTGCDMRPGEVLLMPPRRLDAAAVGLLATLGVTAVPVFRRPIVGLLSCGDELIAPERTPRPGQIRDSNRFALAAAVAALGAEPRHLPIVGDGEGELEAALAAGVADCDAVLVSGGSSVGERDRTPAALAALGRPGVIVHGLRVKPGKPTVLGAVGSKPVIGLPGNPASALLVFDAVIAPIVAALVGAPTQRSVVAARLAAPLDGRPGWTWYAPVRLVWHEDGTALAHPLPLRSASVSLLARADGYVVIAGAQPHHAAGSSVNVERFLGSL